MHNILDYFGFYGIRTNAQIRHVMTCKTKEISRPQTAQKLVPVENEAVVVKIEAEVLGGKTKGSWPRFKKIS